MRARVTASLLAALALAGCEGEGGGESGPPNRFDAERAFADLESQVAIGPRPAGSAASRRTARLIARRLRAAGVDGVRIQRPHRNVVGTIPGQGPGAVVVGAHHDTKDGVEGGFEGANDGASGVAVVLELARSLPRPLPGPSVHVALFDAEEARAGRPFELDGTRGSRQYVAYARRGKQGSPPLDAIDAMVLFDMVGDCELSIPREAFSDPRLYALFADAARERSESGSAAPFEGAGGGVLDDHIPFRDAGIPVVDLIDFRFGPGSSPGGWWHTPADALDKVCPQSLDAVGEAALAAIPRIR